MVICKRLIFLVIRLVGEVWLHWLTGFADTSCLWLPTCVEEMACGILVTVQYRTYWSKMREGMQSRDFSHWITCFFFSEVDGWLQSCLGIRGIRYFENFI